MRWYVAYTGINQEIVAERELPEIVTVYCPKGQKTVRHARRSEIRIFPLFSRYLFIGTESPYEDWCEPVRSTNGIIDILINAHWLPLELPSEEIENLKRRELSGEFVQRSKEKQKYKWQHGFEMLKQLLNPHEMATV